LLDGVRIFELKKNLDERGFFAEIMRDDWKEILNGEKIVQANLSFSYPGMIRAWHRHLKGQTDYFVVLEGAMKICAYDDKTGGLDQIITDGHKLQIVKIPGHYWHGTKTIGDKSSSTVYFTTRLYDYKNPDEERRPWNDSAIIDPATKKPFDWNKPPHK